jgi:hypothetical protein
VIALRRLQFDIGGALCAPIFFEKKLAAQLHRSLCAFACDFPFFLRSAPLRESLSFYAASDRARFMIQA